MNKEKIKLLNQATWEQHQGGNHKLPKLLEEDLEEELK
jgi:hypothetical protein